MYISFHINQDFHQPFPELPVKSRTSSVELLATGNVRWLEKSKRVTNGAIITTDQLPLESSLVEDGQLAEAVVDLVQQGGDVGQTLAGAKFTVALNVAGHAVDDVGDGLAVVGIVGVVVHNGGSIDGAVSAERIKTLVPVDVADENVSG